MTPAQREERIAKLRNSDLQPLVSSISSLMSRHNEPYRTLAECILIAGLGIEAKVSKAVRTRINQAVREDCLG